MIFDSNLLFSNGQSLAVTTSTPSTTVIDLTGNPTAGLNIGNASRYGADMGIGDGVAVLKVAAYVGTALTTTNSATLQIQFQGSTDSSTWDTYIETPAFAAAKLTAGQKLGTFDWPLVGPGFSLPRYIRLNYVLPETTSFTTGTIFAGIVLQRDDAIQGQYPEGFVVA